MIGYWLAQALRNAVPGQTFVALVCQTVVSVDDRALAHPSKFVGQVYGKNKPNNSRKSAAGRFDVTDRHRDGSSLRHCRVSSLSSP